MNQEGECVCVCLKFSMFCGEPHSWIDYVKLNPDIDRYVGVMCSGPRTVVANSIFDFCVCYPFSEGIFFISPC